LRETGDDVLDVAPDAIVVVDERLPIHRRATLQGCDRDAGDDRRLAAQVFRRWRQNPARRVNDAGGVFDAHELFARLLNVALGFARGTAR